MADACAAAGTGAAEGAGIAGEADGAADADAAGAAAPGAGGDDRSSQAIATAIAIAPTIRARGGRRCGWGDPPRRDALSLSSLVSLVTCRACPRRIVTAGERPDARASRGGDAKFGPTSRLRPRAA